MNFDYNEQQKMFQQMARDFATQRVAPLAKEIDKQDRFPTELIKEIADVGLFGILAPEEWGGSGGDRISYCVAIEELSKVSLGVAEIVVMQNSLGQVPILEWGTEEHKKKFLPKLINGEIIAAVAVTEPNHGSDGAVEASAVLKDGTWILNGNKTFSSQGNIADMILTVCQTDKAKRHHGTVAFLLEKGMPGFSHLPIHGKLGYRGTEVAELTYDNLQMPAANMLGKVGEGLKVVMSGLDDARIAVSAYSLGLSQACIDAAVDYAKQRVQFGKIIGSFQLVQAAIADMIVETEAARLLTYKAASMMDTGQRGIVDTNYAKLFASETAQRVSYKAIQLHGAYGYTDDMPVERYFRDARALTIIEGTSDIHRLHIGRHALGISAFV